MPWLKGKFLFSKNEAICVMEPPNLSLFFFSTRIAAEFGREGGGRNGGKNCPSHLLLLLHYNPRKESEKGEIFPPTTTHDSPLPLPFFLLSLSLPNFKSDEQRGWFWCGRRGKKASCAFEIRIGRKKKKGAPTLTFPLLEREGGGAKHI